MQMEVLDDMKTIVLWGDSIGKGIIYSEERGRYCLAKDRCTNLLRQAGLSIECNVRMGATITEGFRQYLETEARPGDIAVIEFGGNDCDPDWDAVDRDPDTFHDGKTPIALFRDTLAQFITEARIRWQQPVAVIPPPLEAERYCQWICRGRNTEHILHYLVDVHHIYRWQERYANAVREVAQTLKCPVLDLRTPFLDARNYPGLMCLDGIHPNEDGHRLMAAAVQDELRKRGLIAEFPQEPTEMHSKAC